MRGRLLHAEVDEDSARSAAWVIGALIVVLATPVGIGLLAHQSCSYNGSACTLPIRTRRRGGGRTTFYFVHQPLSGNGTITASG